MDLASMMDTGDLASLMDTGPRDLAVHEVVGWLLGAMLAKYQPSTLAKLPALLSRSRHAEMDLLCVTLARYVHQELGGGSITRPQQLVRLAALFGGLLRKLREYCGLGAGVGPPHLVPGEGAVRLSDAFLAQVEIVTSTAASVSLAVQPVAAVRPLQAEPGRPGKGGAAAQAARAMPGKGGAAAQAARSMPGRGGAAAQV
eukprot:CAMPEP_0179296488 /NCGR_PEP_ID=MMETSP0797-20121207/44967_1 /TAXON_ID=47934 /ORGANISM="Dinophysis acuminata, Strain DAEP01" /LENGTH=199 /DNA_ID=CAMNT_0021005773 /DNA_START=98 /DNA_END=695 /DNA_ORIENTATION=+